MVSDKPVEDRLTTALSDRYRIEVEIGSGGMATVYLAQDLRHDRKVAVKVLRPELAAVLGAERFLSEIKTTANLQHPHILPLFDSGEAGGFLFYVMPFVEGESLRAKLDREKQLAVEEAVGIAKSVAGALDYAHRHGVIHRDIKPANILLHDGQPMVADFGIALAVRAAGGARLTETGLSLGTPQYMSPEQAAGDREVDGRSDLYSVGAVLYEMLTGETPHSGPTVQAVIAKLLTDKPRPVTELRDTVPVHVAAAVHKALAKLPADRFQGAWEMVETLSGRMPLVAAATGEEPSRSAKASALRALPWVLALAMGAVAVLSAGDRRPEEAGIDSHFNITLPESLPMAFIGRAWGGHGQPAVALSPNGRSLVYVGQADTTTQLFVRSLDGPEFRALPGTEGAVSPFFSPDGRWIGFTANGRLLRVSLDGSSSDAITEAFSPYGCSWNEEDRIVCVTRDAAWLLVTDPAGVNVTRRPIDRDFTSIYAEPQWLPGNSWFLTTCYSPFEVCVVSPESMEIRRVMTSGEAGAPGGVPLAGSNPRYLPDNYLVFSHPEESVVLGVRFDPRRLETRGQPVELLRGVRRESMHGVLQLALSASGHMVYAPGMGTIRGRLVWAGPGGVRDTLHAFPPRLYGPFSLSPNGRRLAIKATSDVGEEELWFMDLERGTETRWTPDDATLGMGGYYGTWLPDSERVINSRSEGDTSVVVVINSLRPTTAGTVVWRGRGRLTPQQVTADSIILFSINTPTGSYTARARLEDLGNLPPDVDQAFPPLLDVPGTEIFPRYSPDGRWLLYGSDHEGPFEQYAQPVDSENPPIRLSHGEGGIGQWTRSGDAVFFRDRQSFFRVEVTGDPEAPFSEPQYYLEGDFLNVPGPELEVHPDGRRLLLLEGPRERTTTQLNFIQNWRHVLEERLGEGR